jgi:hypothetical protein
MIAKNPTEELAFYLMRDTRDSFHFGKISLGVKKLLEAVKEKGYIVSYKADSCEPQLFTEAECLQHGITFEHHVMNDTKIKIGA